jgi:ribosomal protein L37AE/L43A
MTAQDSRTVSRTAFRDRVPRRATATCPVCNGTVRKGRMQSVWTCDDCARRLEDSEVADEPP